MQNTDGFSKLQMLMMTNLVVDMIQFLILMVMILTNYHGDDGDDIDLWRALYDVGESDKSVCNETIMRAIIFSMEWLEKC